MTDLSCMIHCLLANLKKVVRENLHIILAAMAIGALYSACLNRLQVGLRGLPIGVRHPRQRRWLDELGRLKGGRPF